ncbi:hypothetical protein CAPTEDRAFT_199879 [Capitella teleta]|uniref:IPT/TIG domain-containing protein n=1 Tax=Capitella teleta TaxID=283909 RepID=R7UE66_CAPTE|nr:hypothetical protein CAPTEDRAFT_199879 [Capitella teleta]|eukprot:ELU04381.1 hypothetical protein CAPTEDRAFT_199879 [Capitella teleta]
MNVIPTSGPITGGTELTVSGPCIPDSLQLGPVTLHSTQDPYVFVTTGVDVPHYSVPINIVVPTRNGAKIIPLGKNFTYGGFPSVQDIRPRELNIDGGTKITVVGENFFADSNPKMNLTQKAIEVNSPDGLNIFDEVNYPLTPCAVQNGTEMECRTPELQLPSVDDFSSFEVEYRFGFLFEGLEESQQLNEKWNTTTAISVEIAIIQLPEIAKHTWPPYDITWGHFQHETLVHVGGIEAEITRRYHNLIQFLPPDEDGFLVSGESGCSPESYSVEVLAGNTRQLVGCLSFVASDDVPLTMIAVIAACVFSLVVVVVVVSIIACCVIRKSKRSPEN